MMLLALDLATVTGFAWGEAGCAKPTYGSINLRHKAGTPGVIINLADWLGPLCTAIQPDVIVFEAPWLPVGRKGGMPVNANVSRRLYGMTGYVEALALKRKIRCFETTPLEIGKFFLGASRPQKREAKKLATIARCHELGWPVENDDEADAVSIFAMAEDKFCPGIRRAAMGPLFGHEAKKDDAPRLSPARRLGVRTPHLGDEDHASTR